MTVREMIELLSRCDPEAVVVVTSPITGEDNKRYLWKTVEEVAGEPDDLFDPDPSNPLRGSVGNVGVRPAVTIW